MNIATTIIRILIGLLLLFASLGYFFSLMPEPETNGNFKAFNVGLVAATYIMPLAKGIELLCGIAFVSNRFVSLANILILPITINILCIHFFLEPSGIPIAVALFMGNIFLIYRYWDNYKSVFTP